MNRTFTISSRFHPAWSLLGRWIRRRSPDHRVAESTYIVAATALAVVLMLSQYLTWAYLQPVSQPASFAAVQVLVAAVYAGAALAGRQPAQHVHVSDDELRIDCRDAALVVPFSNIRRVSVISAATYYGHYARYAATRGFVNRLYPVLLMLETREGPVILGLQPDDLREMERILSERAESYSPPRVGAA